MGNYESVDCTTACLQDGPYYQEKTSWTAKWAGVGQFSGYFKNNKYFTTTVWNDEEFFYIKVDVYGYQYDQEKDGKDWILTGPTDDNYPFETVIITLNGNTYTYEMDNPETTEIIETATTYTQAFTLDAGWDKCDAMIYSVRIEGNGQPIWLGTSEAPESYTYNLFAPCGCETEMTGETECGTFGENNEYNRKAVYTFTPDTEGNFKMQGGLTNFTGSVYSIVTTHGTFDSWVPGGSSNRIIRIQGSLEECETVTVTVYWNSTNSATYITGDWSTELDDVKVMIVDEMMCDDEKDGYAPVISEE